MLLFDNSVEPPKEWYHNPSFKDINGYTMAFRYANKGIIPPK